MAQLVDFSPLGDLYNQYRQGQAQRAREQALAPYGGDMGLAQLMLMQQRDQRDFKFREQESQRAQGNADRAFALQKQTAEEAARGYEYREVDDGQGGKSLVRIEKATGAVSKPVIAGVPDTPNNPFMTGGKMNESQSKDALYASRMLAAEKVLQTINADTATHPLEKFRGVVSDRIGYNIRSPEYQKFDQAQRDFINATLRRESGAVISDAEFDNARKQYFPQPGDNADTLTQKRQNRLEAIRGIGAGAGQGYRPTLTIGADGSIVDNPKPQPKTQTADPNAWRSKEAVTAARANKEGTLNEARAAIAAGAPREVVVQRLQQVGIDPSGL